MLCALSERKRSVCTSASHVRTHDTISKVQRQNRMEGALHKNHEDHIAGKRMNSLSHYKLVHQFIPKPQALKKDAKAAVEKEWEKLEKHVA